MANLLEISVITNSLLLHPCHRFAITGLESARSTKDPHVQWLQNLVEITAGLWGFSFGMSKEEDLITQEWMRQIKRERKTWGQEMSVEHGVRKEL